MSADPRKEALRLLVQMTMQLKAVPIDGGPWSDRNGGWIEPARQKWLVLFADFHDRLAAGSSDFSHEASHLIRELDHDGVVGGVVQATAAQLQDRFQQIVEASDSPEPRSS
jgi:hypothetical protein